MDVRITPVKRSFQPRKTDSTQTANQNSKLLNSRVASLADDLPFDDVFPLSDDPLAYVG
jgi:hypothetical protein